MELSLICLLILGFTLATFGACYLSVETDTEDEDE